jgi:predicted alpha/beta-hydrolase family hydrolase
LCIKTRVVLAHRGKGCAKRRIIFERCIKEYIRQGICGASFKFCVGNKLREEMERSKRDETFSVHTPSQIVFQIILKILGLLKNETLHHERIRDE